MLCFKNDTDDPARTLSGLTSQNHLAKSVFKLHHFRGWLQGTDVTYGSSQTWAELCSDASPLQMLSLSFTGGSPLHSSPHFGSRPSQLAFGMNREWPCPTEIQKCHLAPSDHMELSQSYIAGEEQKPLVSNACIIRKLLEFLRHSSHPHNLSGWVRAPCSGIRFYPAPGTLITLPNQALISAWWKHCPWYFCWSYF